MSNPYFELEKAIVTKLKASSTWPWPIYGDVDEPGKQYLEISNVTAIDNSAKKQPIRDFLVSFDAWDLELTSVMNISTEVMKILYTMEELITLDNHISGLTPLTLGGGFVDISHQPESGPEEMANVDPGIKHARQIIKFKLAMPTGG